MIIQGKDPHPGRCQNYRTSNIFGGVESLRCLEAEGTRHVCRFPPSRAQWNHDHGSADWGSITIKPSEPKTWVVPPLEEV